VPTRLRRHFRVGEYNQVIGEPIVGDCQNAVAIRFEAGQLVDVGGRRREDKMRAHEDRHVQHQQHQQTAGESACLASLRSGSGLEPRLTRRLGPGS
jgi:hypothetical protein